MPSLDALELTESMTAKPGFIWDTVDYAATLNDAEPDRVKDDKEAAVA
jgi:hypothetical protein